MKTKLMMSVVTVGMVLACALPMGLQAAANSYTNAGNGAWDAAANWSSGFAPTNTDSVFITNGAFGVSLTNTTSTSWMTVSNLAVYGSGAGPNLLINFADQSKTFTVGSGTSYGTITLGSGAQAGTLTSSNGNLSARNVVFGSAGQWNISGGTNTIYSGSSGYDVGGAGSVVLNGGALNIGGGDWISVGSLAVSNGTLNTAGLGVGRFFSGEGAKVGSMHMDGGVVNATSVTSVGGYGGDTGTVVQTGGTFTGGGTVYIGATGDGTWLLSNGTFNASKVLIASAAATATGRLNIYGGTNTISGPLNVGAFAGATGSVLVANSGLLEFKTSGAITNGLSTGAGTITNQNGGTIQFDVNPTIAINNGSFVVTNATIAFNGLANAAVTGSITNIAVQAGSRLRLDTSTNAAGLAGLNVGGAGNYAQLELTGNNSLWQSASLTVNTGGTLVGNSSALVSVTGGLTNMGMVLVSNQFSVASSENFYGLGSSNTFAKGVSITSGGTLEITNSVASVAGTIANSGVMRVSGSSTLSASNVTLASGAQWIVSGGSNTTSSGSANGYGVGGVGSVVLNGGVLTVGGAQWISVGSLAVSNGILNTAVVGVGDASAGAGGTAASMRMDGGVVNAATWTSVGRYGGTGTVVQAGGTFNGGSTVYIGPNGNGTYLLSNGTFNASAVRIASDDVTGRGRLNIYGGTNTISGPLNVGAIAGATGSVLVSDLGLLEFKTSGAITAGLSTGAGTITNQNGGMIQFDVNPTITLNNGSFVVTNATLAFKGLANAAVGSVTNNVAGVTVQAGSRLRLDSSTNATGLTGFNVGGVGNYAQLELAGVNSLWQSTNLTVGVGGALIANASARVSVLGTYQNLGSSIFSNLYTVASGSRYQSWGGATNQFVGGLTIASGGWLDVTNGQSLIGGTITNAGTMTVMNSLATYQGNVVNQGAYVSDPSTNTFNGNFTVGPTATVVAAANDIYAFGSNFVMSSTNRAFDMSLAKVVFADTGYGLTTGTTNHTFDLTGSGAVDKGSNWLDHTQLATNFSIGTLTIALNNRLTLTGNAGTNALYVGVLDLSAWATNASSLTNTLTAALSLPNINLYYDKYDANNAYLQGVEFGLWSGGGLLIPIPEPSTLALTLAATALSLFILRRKDQRE